MASQPTQHLNIVSLFEEGFADFKKSWYKIAPFGILTMLPLALLIWSPLIGGITILTLQGPLLLLFVEMTHTKQIAPFWKSKSDLFLLFENGFLLIAILFPLITLSILLLFIPAVLVISLFIFSGSLIVLKKRFAIDALMESISIGKEHRLSLIFIAFFMLTSIAISFVFTESIPLLFAVVSGLLISYEMAVVVAVYNHLPLGNDDE